VSETGAKLEIRVAVASDLDAIIGLLEQDAIGIESQAREVYARAFDEIGASPENELIVATMDGEVIGTLQLTYIPGMLWERRAQVESVRVRSDRRNLQIGSALMKWAIERSRERGCRLLQLTTNAVRTDAQRFYQRLGFKPSHVGMKLFL
jgi:GNAT superfamily N-acetyltransferase